jgi:hypothetical protein
MRALVPILCLLLAGCCKPELIRVPGPVEYRDKLVVQPIPAELLEEHPVATGQLSECPFVASQRKAELTKCNSDKKALRDRAIIDPADRRPH